MIKRKLLLIGVSVSVLIGAVSVATSSGVELHEFFNAKGERVMKSLVGEFTQNEKWSVKGALMGECWYKNCCISEHPNNLRCGKPETEDGNEKMRMLICSEEIQKLLNELN